MKTLKVIVDERERNAEINSLLKENMLVERKTIDVGDYVVSDRICIERKAVPDFESSLINGRLFEQAKMLKESYEHPIIIVEGDVEDFRLAKNVIIGTFVALYVDNGIEVIMSRNPKETYEFIKVIAKHEQDGSIREPSLKGARRAHSTSDYQEFIIANLPGIGIKMARSLLKHFGNIKCVANASIEELMKVEKVGEKKALMIHSVINDKYAEKNV
jgi:Fanconi anemia group M protein